jgi:methyltransferase-like protein/SAM-dependent methyltransferase
MPMTVPLRTSYDDVPYPAMPRLYAHPDHLAVVATLLGLCPARADHCRTLELGCADGGNLIPLAYAYPESTFLGIDQSVVEIRKGEELREALGLGNIELRAMNVLDVDDRLGYFDFIICHGVYSWVPAAVQDKILEIYARQLAPDGIGFVSYNTFPGWHMRGMIRSMMLVHDRRFRDHPPQQRIDQARALLAFLAEAYPQQQTPYRVLLRSHLDLLSKCSDSYLFHEYLEECNEPIYFTDFCERLAVKGLRFLSETAFDCLVPSTSFPPAVLGRLQAMASNLLEFQQYSDFLHNRPFRETLICHARLQPNYGVRADRLAAFHVASLLRPSVQNPDLTSDLPAEFTSVDGISLTSPIPIVKAALTFLSEIWPRPVPFDELVNEARSRLSGPIPSDYAADAQALGKALLTAYASAGRDLVKLWLCPPAFSSEVNARPLASRLARLQSASSNRVTNMRHEPVILNPFDARLLRLLDGTRDREDLIEALRDGCQETEFSVLQGGQPVTEVSQVSYRLDESIDECLHRFAKTSLLSPNPILTARAK